MVADTVCMTPTFTTPLPVVNPSPRSLPAGRRRHCRLPRDAKRLPSLRWLVYGPARLRTGIPVERSAGACAPWRQR